MARREYRDKTGKLLGYSQNETDRTGKGMTSIIITVLGFVGLAIWHYFFSSNPAPTNAQKPVPSISEPESGASANP